MYDFRVVMLKIVRKRRVQTQAPLRPVLLKEVNVHKSFIMENPHTSMWFIRFLLKNTFYFPMKNLFFCTVAVHVPGTIVRIFLGEIGTKYSLGDSATLPLIISHYAFIITPIV